MVESAGGANIASTAQAQPAVSDVDKAKAEAEQAAEVAAHPSKGKFVLYLGPSNITAAAEELTTRTPKLGEGTFAEITAAQWTEAGVPSTRTHKWSLANSWTIAATQFSQEQIDYLLENSKRFELVDSEGRKVDS